MHRLWPPVRFQDVLAGKIIQTKHELETLKGLLECTLIYLHKQCHKQREIKHKQGLAAALDTVSQMV